MRCSTPQWNCPQARRAERTADHAAMLRASATRSQQALARNPAARDAKLRQVAALLGALP